MKRLIRSLDNIFKVAFILFVSAVLGTHTANARSNIQVAGSSTVLPFATIVAESFGENFDYPTPVVQGGGSGAGRKMLCEGVGENTIDIANSSSRIKQSDIDNCTSNGVNEIMEVRFGYDGIVFASDINGPSFSLTPEDIYNALGKSVVNNGQLDANQYQKWSDINPNLPDQAILAFIPGTKHGTREVFDEKVIIKGCEKSGALEIYMAQGADKKAAEKMCLQLRTDGISIDIDGDYTETLARMEANPQAIGVFGLSFYENNADKLQVSDIDNVVPSIKTISSGEYPVSRPLYFYVKNAHLGVIPGLQEYVEFFVSDDMAGDGGLLAEYGLVPDPELENTQEMVAYQTPMEPLK